MWYNKSIIIPKKIDILKRYGLWYEGDVKRTWHKKNIQRAISEYKQPVYGMNDGKNIVIGTHGTALSSILNYYNPKFNCDDFLRIVDWMPYIIELDFEGEKCVGVVEHAYVEKAFPERMTSFKR